MKLKKRLPSLCRRMMIFSGRSPIAGDCSFVCQSVITSSSGLGASPRPECDLVQGPGLEPKRLEGLVRILLGSVQLDRLNPHPKVTRVQRIDVLKLRAIRPPQPNAALWGQHRLTLPEGGCCLMSAITGGQYDS